MTRTNFRRRARDAGLIIDELLATRTVLIEEVKVIDGLFRAVMESVEEAIVNSLFCAETMTGRDDHTVSALPVDEVLAMVNLATTSRSRETPNDLTIT